MTAGLFTVLGRVFAATCLAVVLLIAAVVALGAWHDWRVRRRGDDLMTLADAVQSPTPESLATLDFCLWEIER